MAAVFRNAGRLRSIGMFIVVLLAAFAVPASTRGAGTPTASEMMNRARRARAEWNDFTGFEARVTVVRNHERTTGTLVVTSAFKVLLTVADADQARWAARSLKSVVGHRRPSPPRNDSAEFADDAKHHPLGRLIRLKDDSAGSRFRIKGDVMTEVHRKNNVARFTISVAEVYRNREGKRLPRSYSFSTWDVKTGDLKSNTMVHDTWKRVGGFDLPKSLLWVTTGNDGKREVRQILLEKHRLLDVSATAK